MKLLLASDFHFDVNERMTGNCILGRVIQAIASYNPEVIVISGDVAGGARKVISYLDQMKEALGIPVYFVPGNHDIWVHKGDFEDSWAAYGALYNHESSLLRQTVKVGGITLVGGMSWYDYSMGPLGITDDMFAHQKRKFWNDAKYAKWHMSDPEVTKKMLLELEIKLEAIKEEEVLLVNHYLPYEDFVTVKADYNWNICNAYMGTNKLGELIDRYENVRTVLFGHTHRRYGDIEDYHGKRIICKPLGYFGEWESDTIEEEIHKCLTLIEA
jgi:putative phosphoesterase